VNWLDFPSLNDHPPQGGAEVRISCQRSAVSQKKTEPVGSDHPTALATQYHF
jgi:hypothetical protein